MLRSSSSATLGGAKVPKVVPTNPADYDLIEEIGQGVSAKVGRQAVIGLLRRHWPDAGARPAPPRRCGGRCASRPARSSPSRCWTSSDKTRASWCVRLRAVVSPRAARARGCQPRSRGVEPRPADLHHFGAARCPSHDNQAHEAKPARISPRCAKLTPAAQEEIRKEAQTMSLLNHPNLVSCYCSFVNGPVRSLATAERAAPV